MRDASLEMAHAEQQKAFAGLDLTFVGQQVRNANQQRVLAGLEMRDAGLDLAYAGQQKAFAGLPLSLVRPILRAEDGTRVVVDTNVKCEVPVTPPASNAGRMSDSSLRWKLGTDQHTRCCPISIDIGRPA